MPFIRRRVVFLAVALVVLLGVVLAILWQLSPFDQVSGPSGRLTTAGMEVQAGPPRYQLSVQDPAIVAGAALTLNGGGVRAIDLASGDTYWRLTRPGRAVASTLWRVGDRYVAIVWSDRRLTVVDVPTARHWDRSLPNNDVASDAIRAGSSDLAIYGLDRPGGLPPLVGVVERRAVDTYDATSGRSDWSYAVPPNQAIADPVGDAHPTGTTLLLNLSTDNYNVYEQDHSLVLDNQGRITLRLTVSTSADASMTYAPVALGDGRIAQLIDNGLASQVYDASTGRKLYQLPGSPHGLTGDGDMLVIRDGDLGVSAYRAADGSLLWQQTFSPQGCSSVRCGDVRSFAVYQGKARIIQQYDSPDAGCGSRYRLLTFDASGVMVGVKPLSAVFDCQPGDIFPSLVDGRDGALIAKDNASIINGQHDHYVLEVG